MKTKSKATGDTAIERVEQVVAHVHFPGYFFEVREGHGGMFLRAMYFDTDAADPENADTMQSWWTRKWLISPHATASEIVQTAFKCVLTSAEHRVREGFRYGNKQVFGPHFDVEDLVQLCRDGKTNAGARKNEPTL